MDISGKVSNVRRTNSREDSVLPGKPDINAIPELEPSRRRGLISQAYRTARSRSSLVRTGLPESVTWTIGPLPRAGPEVEQDGYRFRRRIALDVHIVS